MAEGKLYIFVQTFNTRTSHTFKVIGERFDSRISTRAAAALCLGSESVLAGVGPGCWASPAAGRGKEIGGDTRVASEFTQLEGVRACHVESDSMPSGDGPPALRRLAQAPASAQA